MTPAASSSAPFPSPSQAKAAPGREKPCWLGSAIRRCCALDALTGELPTVKLLGKAEWHNPGGSVKDRAAARIVAEARRSRQTCSRKNSARFHQRQHRHRLCHAGRGSRISRHAVRARECFSRAKTHSTGIRRKYHLHRSRRRLRWRHQDRAPAGRAASRSLFLRRSVLERCQLACPLRDHRQRNLAADRRTHHAFRGHAGHHRNFRRHHAPVEGTESADPLHLAAARLRVPRDRGREASAVGDRAADLRCVAGR